MDPENAAKHMPRGRHRFQEIDLLRGVALIMMLVSNFVTDLQYFLGYSQHEEFWKAFAYTTAGLFVAISGTSMWIAHHRVSGYGKYLARFAKLFGLGVLITLTTHLFLREGTIYFGVLHFLGVASIMALPLYRLGWMNLLLVPLFLAGKFVVDRLHSSNLLLLPLGITPVPFFTFDYFPIFPWFGVFLLGVGAGAIAYPDGARRLDFSIPNNPLVNGISALGRHTLKVYLVHQPVFVGLLLLYAGSLPGLELGW